MKLLALSAFVVSLVACGGSPGSSDSGIRGRALIGPACPVEPCPVHEALYEGSFVVRKDGATVAIVKTSAKGRFEQQLDPGRYVVESESGGLPLLKPVQIIVREHEFTDLTLNFDSGIR
jgi:hypothetical protein